MDLTSIFLQAARTNEDMEKWIDTIKNKIGKKYVFTVPWHCLRSNISAIPNQTMMSLYNFTLF